MDRHKKVFIKNNIRSVLYGNEGTSLILVAIISILIVTGVVILRVTTSSLWATADKQLNQDRAYMMAVTLGDSIDKMIQDGTITDLTTLDGFDDSASIKNAINNSSIHISVSTTDKGYTFVTITSRVADAKYEYKLTYFKNSSYVRQY